MLKKIIYLLSLSICISVKSVFAQATFLKGFVVLAADKDTLHGEIKTNPKRPAENFSKAAYRKKEGSEIKSYNASKLLLYQMGNSLFVSKIIDNEAVFVKLISGGRLSLYEYKSMVPAMNDSKLETDYYMQRGNNEMIRIKTNKFKKQVMEIFPEKDNVVLSFPNEDFDVPKIISWFETFNSKAE